MRQWSVRIPKRLIARFFFWADKGNGTAGPVRFALTGDRNNGPQTASSLDRALTLVPAPP